MPDVPASVLVKGKEVVKQIWKEFQSSYIKYDADGIENTLQIRHDRAIKTNEFVCKYSSSVFLMLKSIWIEAKQINDTSEYWEQLYPIFEKAYNTSDIVESENKTGTLENTNMYSDKEIYMKDVMKKFCKQYSM